VTPQDPPSRPAPDRRSRLARAAERLRRGLASPAQPGGLSPGARTALFFGVLALLVLLVVRIDAEPSLRHVQVAMLSGSPAGQYHATVDRLAEEVRHRGGALTNVASAGSVENLQRLIDAAASCDTAFALVQDGVDLPEGHGLELLGRLPDPESLVILAPAGARAPTGPDDLRGLRLGIGPVGSGTEQVMRRLLAPLGGLQLVLSTAPFDAQLDQLEQGGLDLAAMVIHDGAQLLADALARRGLVLVEMPDVASLARRLPEARVGVIERGQIDYVGHRPRQDVRVLQLDTLLVGNGCGSNGSTQGLLTAVSRVFPSFVNRNREQTRPAALPVATVAENFIADGGPDLLGRHAPWAIDIMPLPTWIQVGVGLSVLFSAMRLAHRFRLWRVDATRVKIERAIAAELDGGQRADGLLLRVAEAEAPGPEARARIDDLLARLQALSTRCRRHSVSLLVPMGEEMSYRYQERLIADLIEALRRYRDADALVDGAGQAPAPPD